MKLPTPIQTYFSAEPPQDAEAFAAAFVREASVHDEGHIYRGREEIRARWQAAKAKYRHRAELLDTTDAAGKAVIRARVSGDFPGSPAGLTFIFGLAGNRITDLDIR